MRKCVGRGKDLPSVMNLLAVLYMQLFMHIHHYVSTFLQVVALNELKVKWLSIKGISKIILKYLTEGISFLCVLSKNNTGRLKKGGGGAMGLEECIKPK